jgi:hypothetical protein
LPCSPAYSSRRVTAPAVFEPPGDSPRWRCAGPARLRRIAGHGLAAAAEIGDSPGRYSESAVGSPPSRAVRCCHGEAPPQAGPGPGTAHRARPGTPSESSVPGPDERHPPEDGGQAPAGGAGRIAGREPGASRAGSRARGPTGVRTRADGGAETQLEGMHCTTRSRADEAGEGWTRPGGADTEHVRVRCEQAPQQGAGGGAQVPQPPCGSGIDSDEPGGRHRSIAIVAGGLEWAR